MTGLRSKAERSDSISKKSPLVVDPPSPEKTSIVSDLAHFPKETKTFQKPVPLGVISLVHNVNVFHCREITVQYFSENIGTHTNKKAKKKKERKTPNRPR